jgi:hypothetical protein
MPFDVAPYLPYVGLVAVMVYGLYMARSRAPGDLNADAGDLLLRQGEASARDLETCRRNYRRLERDYQALALWALDVRGKLARRAPDEDVTAMPTRSVNGDTPTAMTVTDRDEVRLRRVLVDRLRPDELKTLAFDLGCEDLPDGTQSKQVIALMDYVRTRHLWPQLIKWLADNRKDIVL